MLPLPMDDSGGQRRTKNTPPVGYHSGTKIESRRRESNPGPLLYESSALAS